MSKRNNGLVATLFTFNDLIWSLLACFMVLTALLVTQINAKKQTEKTSDEVSAGSISVYAYWQALYSPGSGLLGLPADAPVVERKNPLFSLSIKPLHKCLFSRREGFRGTIVDTAWGYYSIVFVLFRKVIL